GLKCFKAVPTPANINCEQLLVLVVITMSWSNSEVRALIAIWGEDIQSQLDGAARNKSIFETISKKMLEVGYSRDWKQCC
uniref:Myb/SANT-like DNA-binding domain-containing protein n=1 Tax=Amphimedon queenslandica TaxID=400682 RepID=A0A1X7TY41_AMPQE